MAFWKRQSLENIGSSILKFPDDNFRKKTGAWSSAKKLNVLGLLRTARLAFWGLEALTWPLV